MTDIAIRGDTIRLGQLLKFAGVASSGDEAKAILATGKVRVNGKPEQRRGAQLHAGDIVHAGGEELTIVVSED
ncbi:MAG TPA: RNA-binding S4 domain-containing protein [Baekduia sp.]|nr:RNA-binding S4 domain-containing protein [Baekduia sp.]